MTPILVQSEDRYGNEVTEDSGPVSIGVSRLSDCSDEASQPISGENSSVQVSGKSKFFGFSHKKAEKIYIKTTSRIDPTLFGCSAGLTVIPAVPKSIRFFRQPEGGIAGEFMENQPSVELIDEFGNRVDESSGLVDLAAFSDSGCNVPAEGILSSKSTPLKNGLSLFSEVSYTRTSLAFLRAKYALGGREVSACSGNLNLLPGSPSRISFSEYEASAVAGDSFGVTLKVRDRFGNDVPGVEKTATIVPHSDSSCRIRATGEFKINGDPLKRIVDLVNGSASISTSLSKSGTMFLRATLGGSTSTTCSGAIQIVPGKPNFIKFINQPGSYNGIIGRFLTDSPTLMVTDLYGNKVDSASGLISLSSFTSPGCLIGNSIAGRFIWSPANIIGGLAAFTNLSYDKTQLLYLKASYSTESTILEDCSNPVSYNIDPAGITILFDEVPSSEVAGQSFLIKPKVKLLDNQGRLVGDSVFSGDTGRISLSVFSDPGCSSVMPAPGILTANPAIVSNGYATFNPVRYSMSGKIYLKASFGSKTTCSPALTIKASSISRVNVDDFSQYEIQAGNKFEEFDVRIEDEYGNLVTDKPGTITAKSYSNNTCTVATESELSGDSSDTSDGVAGFSTLSFNKASEIYIQWAYRTNDGSTTVLSKCSELIKIKPNIPSVIKISNNPGSSAIVNENMKQRPSYVIEDGFGNNSGVSNSQVILQFYSDSSCSLKSENQDVYLRTTDGVVTPPSLIFSKTGTFYIKATLPSNGISRCFGGDSEKIRAFEKLSASLSRPRTAEKTSLPILISGGAEPRTCVVTTSVTSGHSMSQDCGSLNPGTIQVPTDPVYVGITISDQVGQSVSLAVEVVKSASLSADRSTVSALDYTKVKVNNLTHPFGSTKCYGLTESACPQSGSCLWTRTHTTPQVCSGVTEADNSSCYQRSYYDCEKISNCKLSYGHSDLISGSCVNANQTTACTVTSVVGSVLSGCNLSADTNEFFISSGYNNI